MCHWLCTSVLTLQSVSEAGRLFKIQKTVSHLSTVALNTCSELKKSRVAQEVFPTLAFNVTFIFPQLGLLYTLKQRKAFLNTYSNRKYFMLTETS
jgi:hypothetical protein